MVKMTSNGVTISVPPSEVDFYKRAGYAVDKDEPKPEPTASDKKPAPAKEK